MNKVYLVINHCDKHPINESYTDIVHICNDSDLAVEYANSFVNDFIHDSLRKEYKGCVWIEKPEGKYYTKSELFHGVCYLGFAIDDSIVESYDIKIEEYEVKEDWYGKYRTYTNIFYNNIVSNLFCYFLTSFYNSQNIIYRKANR